jgi:hypothetical protein
VHFTINVVIIKVIGQDECYIVLSQLPRPMILTPDDDHNGPNM